MHQIYRIMKIYEGLAGPFHIKNPVVTTGTFDGVHVGHRKIIQRLNQIAAENQGESTLITFEPHPRLVLFPDDNNLRLLSNLNEKIQLLQESGIQNLVIIPFTRDFSRMTSFEYVQDILLNKLHMRHLVIGYDHHFGRNREGSITELRAYSNQLNFEVEEIPAQDIDDIKVSSTKIRHALLEGDIPVANQFLTYSYRLQGTVVHGDKRGRLLGFPTANLQVQDTLKLIPMQGVYAVEVKLADGIFGGMLNIGTRPTVNGQDIRLEVHIFNWNSELYGMELEIRFKERIRNERRFESMEALTSQLQTDKRTALDILNKV